MKKVKIIIQIDGEMTRFWFTIATPKEIVALESKLNKIIVEDKSWTGVAESGQKKIKN